MALTNIGLKNYKKNENFYVTKTKELVENAWLEYTKYAYEHNIDISAQDIILLRATNDTVYCNIVGPSNEVIYQAAFRPHSNSCDVELKKPEKKASV